MSKYEKNKRLMHQRPDLFQRLLSDLEIYERAASPLITKLKDKIKESTVLKAYLEIPEDVVGQRLDKQIKDMKYDKSEAKLLSFYLYYALHITNCIESVFTNYNYPDRLTAANLFMYFERLRTLTCVILLEFADNGEDVLSLIELEIGITIRHIKPQILDDILFDEVGVYMLQIKDCLYNLTDIRYGIDTTPYTTKNYRNKYDYFGDTDKNEVRLYMKKVYPDFDPEYYTYATKNNGDKNDNKKK